MVQVHFKKSVNSNNVLVLLKAVKEVKATMSTGKQFRTSTTWFTENVATIFVLLLYRQVSRNGKLQVLFLLSSRKAIFCPLAKKLLITSKNG